MDITFENPAYLWLLFSLPLLVISHFILLRFVKKKAMKFANFEAMKRVTGTTFHTKNFPILILRVLTVLFLILAVSGATIWYEGFTNENDFVLAIDSSASMSTQDFQPNRLEAAKEAAKEFIDSLSSRTEIGLVSFAGTAFIEQMPTADFLKVKQKINEIYILPAGGTDLSAAIITSSNMLLNSKKGKAIILITDGSNTAGPFVEDVVQRGIDYARRQHVIIYTIGIGTNEASVGFLPEELGITAIFDESVLSRISNGTGGEFYKAENKEEIKEAYRKIGEKSEKNFISMDLRFILLLFTLILIFIEWGLISTKFRALP